MTKQFEKYLFGLSLANNYVAKYTDGDKVILVHERDDKEIDSVTFDTEEACEDRIDEIVPENDQIYNKANALNLVLDELFNS